MKRKYSKNNIIIKSASLRVIWIDTLIYDCYLDKIKNLNIFFPLSSQSGVVGMGYCFQLEQVPHVTIYVGCFFGSLMATANQKKTDIVSCLTETFCKELRQNASNVKRFKSKQNYVNFEQIKNSLLNKFTANGVS